MRTTGHDPGMLLGIITGGDIIFSKIQSEAYTLQYLLANALLILGLTAGGLIPKLISRSASLSSRLR